MLKKVFKKEEFFLDKESSPYGGLNRTLYVRIEYTDGYEWMTYDQMGFNPLMDSDKEKLEEMYNSL